MLKPNRSTLMRYGVYVAIAAWIYMLLQFFDVFEPHVFNHAPGECDYVKGIVNGSDDSAESRHGVFVSGGFRTPKIYLANGRRAKAVTMKGAPYAFVPLGISIFEDDDHSRLFVVNGWTDGWGRSSAVEVFDVENNGRALKHVRTVKSDTFNYVSGIHAVSADTFWFTNAYGLPFPLYHLEFFVRYGGGAAGFYDGSVATLVGKHIAAASGLAMNKEKLYVASAGRKAIVVFQVRDRQIDRLGEVPVNCVLDKLNIDQGSGDLWVACQPVFYQLVAKNLGLIGGPLPSKVLRVQVPQPRYDFPSSVIEVYSNGGARYGHGDGAACALTIGSELWIGSVEGRMLHCHMTKYID